MKLAWDFFQSLCLLSEVFRHDCRVPSCFAMCKSGLLLSDGPCCVLNACRVVL